MSDPYHLPAGEKVYIGAPSQPWPDEVVGMLRARFSELEPGLEVHLPMVYVPGHIDPAAIVVFAIRSPQHSEVTVRRLCESVITEVLPAGTPFMLMINTEDSPLVPAVRNAGCKICDNRTASGHPRPGRQERSQS